MKRAKDDDDEGLSPTQSTIYDLIRAHGSVCRENLKFRDIILLFTDYMEDDMDMTREFLEAYKAEGGIAVLTFIQKKQKRNDECFAELRKKIDSHK